MKSMKASIDRAVRGELRINGEVHAYSLDPGEHNVHPDVFAALKAAGIAKKALKATNRKEPQS